MNVIKVMLIMMMTVMMMVMVAVPEVLMISPAALGPARYHLRRSVGQVVGDHLASCHVVAATWHRHSLGLDHVLR